MQATPRSVRYAHCTVFFGAEFCLFWYSHFPVILLLLISKLKWLYVIALLNDFCKLNYGLLENGKSIFYLKVFYLLAELVEIFILEP